MAITTVHTELIAADAVTGAKIADDAIDSEHYTDGSIDTAHIADDQVTLAKMASGTDGQILTSTGAGSPPAFEDAAEGGISAGKAIAMAMVFG